MVAAAARHSVAERDMRKFTPICCRGWTPKPPRSGRHFSERTEALKSVDPAVQCDSGNRRAAGCLQHQGVAGDTEVLAAANSCGRDA